MLLVTLMLLVLLLLDGFDPQFSPLGHAYDLVELQNMNAGLQNG